MSELIVSSRPELSRPVLVAAFRGWNDGGQGASMALEDAVVLAHLMSAGGGPSPSDFSRGARGDCPPGASRAGSVEAALAAYSAARTAEQLQVICWRRMCARHWRSF